MVFPSLIAWVYFVLLAPPSSTEPPGFLPLTIYAVGKIIQFSLPLFWMLGITQKRPILGQCHASGLWIAGGFGLAVAAATLTVYFGILRGSPILAQTPEKVREKVELFHAATPLSFIGLAIFLSAIHSFLEEYYWRWFMFGQLRDQIGSWFGGLVSSLGFMGHHVIVLGVYFPGRFLTLALPFSISVALGGGMWAWLYARERSLVAPWISHMIVDGAIMVIGYDMVFRRAG